MADDPYIIKDLETLDAMRNEPYAHYMMISDVEIWGLWEPFAFDGELDGRGYTISGLEVDKTDGSMPCGLFSVLRGHVHDLNIRTGRTHVRASSSQYSGVLAGQALGTARAYKVLVEGKIDHGGDRGGGLIGYLSTEAYIYQCVCLVEILGGASSRIYSVSGFIDTIGWGRSAGVHSSAISGRSAAPSTSLRLVDLNVSQLADSANYPPEFDFEQGSWEITGEGLPRVREQPVPVIEPGGGETPPGQASKVSGVVQIDGTPAERTVRAFGYNPTTHAIDDNTVSQSKSLGHATSDPNTGEYTIDLLGGYDREIFVVAFDDYGDDFTPDRSLSVGDRIHPTTPNGYVWECTGAGTLPSEEPTWVVDTETAHLYGTASMITRPFYRPMVHGPVAPEAG